MIRAIIASLLLLTSLYSCKSLEVKCDDKLKFVKEKCPEKFRDQDTVFVDVPKIDTVYKEYRDTILITKSIPVEIINYRKDTVYINGDTISCEDCLEACIDSTSINVDCPDQQIITKNVPVMPSTGEIIDYLWSKYNKIVFGIISFLIALFLISRFKKLTL